MNRKEWYKQRRLYRLSRLVYNSYGEDGDQKAYDKMQSFSDTIKQASEYRLADHGYNMKEIFSKISIIREQDNQEHLTKYKETVRYCMRRNAAMARISVCSCTPANYFRGFR